MWTKNPNHINKFTIPGYEDIGSQCCHNNPRLISCRDAKHKRREIDNSYHQYRADDIIYICDDCKNFYHIDMSD